MDNMFFIYGAGIVATSIYTAIKALYNHIPLAFLVSASEGNPERIDGIPVLALQVGMCINGKGMPEKGADEEVVSLRGMDRSARILLAAPEPHHRAIAESLFQAGVTEEQLIFVDNQLENKLMEAYYASQSEFSVVQDLLGAQKGLHGSTPDEVADGSGKSSCGSMANMVSVFQAKCHVDKPLQNIMKVPLPAYMHPIQVGAALTDKRIAEIRDNEGENISHKNANYCELTATYYAWKNSNAEYKGLCHYRRIFDISDAQLGWIFAEGKLSHRIGQTGDSVHEIVQGRQMETKNKSIDVILPYPTIHYPNIDSQHKRYVKDEDWNACMQALKEVAPDYYEAYVTEIAEEQYFYNYNMLIAKREVFNDYCDFLFRVLERTEELVTPKGWERADRFAGYLGENLTTLYFRKNRDKLKIVHTGKLWLT